MNIRNHNGILDDIVQGKFIDPFTNKKLFVPIKKIEIMNSLDGFELDLIDETHPNEKILLISDEFTNAALGKRIYNNLNKKINIEEFIWKNPVSNIEGVNYIRNISKNFTVLIAIGSGTISDTVKYVTFLDKKKYSVFPTSPNNAYTSPTASISFEGLKKSIAAHTPTGVYFDLSVIAKAPYKLISSSFSDVLCRTTSQVDWFLSNKLLNTKYMEIPYYLLNLYENELIQNAEEIKARDINAIGLLTRVSAIMGLCSIFVGSTHYGSMSEHSISHFIDMFAKNLHPGTSHGEQVGIATLTISKIQNSIFDQNTPPVLKYKNIPYDKINKFLGNDSVKLINQQMSKKIFTETKIKNANLFLENNWNDITNQIKKIMITYENLWKIMGKYDSIRTPNEAHLDEKFYKNAIRYSMYFRDRYTILDFAFNSDHLEKYID